MSIQTSYNSPIHFSPYFQSQNTTSKSSDASHNQQFLAELKSMSRLSTAQTESDSRSSQTSRTDSPETLSSDPSLILPYLQAASATHQPCDPSVTQQLLAALKSAESDASSGQTGGTDSPETLPSDPSLILPYLQGASATHQPCDPSVTQQLLAALKSMAGSSTGEAGDDTTS